jgi:hypothetical protein
MGGEGRIFYSETIGLYPIIHPIIGVGMGSFSQIIRSTDDFRVSSMYLPIYVPSSKMNGP